MAACDPSGLGDIVTAQACDETPAKTAFSNAVMKQMSQVDRLLAAKPEK